jgi:hypothetical protein
MGEDGKLGRLKRIGSMTDITRRQLSLIRSSPNIMIPGMPNKSVSVSFTGPD